MEDGRSVGVVSSDQARYLAEQSGLDLVELNGNANPPIVRLLDYNKYRYQQEKNARSGAIKQKSSELKEIRLSFKIDSHDLAIKAKRVASFLEQGSFVRAYIQLRGRENIFPDKAKQKLEEFAKIVDAEVEKTATQSGKRIEIILKPKKK
jgi:translation initiation factor IF-3